MPHRPGPASPGAARRRALSSGGALVSARGAFSGPLQSANSLNEAALVHRAHGAALVRRSGPRSDGKPPSAHLSRGRGPRRVALLLATPRVWSSFSDRPALRGVACGRAGRARTLPGMRRGAPSECILRPDGFGPSCRWPTSVGGMSPPIWALPAPQPFTGPEDEARGAANGPPGHQWPLRSRHRGGPRGSS